MPQFKDTANFFSIFDQHEETIEKLSKLLTSTRNEENNSLDQYLNKFGKIKKIVCRETRCFVISEEVENLLPEGIEVSNITWYQVQDDFQLREGEYINYTSCAAYTCTFISSHGRLFACGSNQFAEIAQPTVGHRVGSTISKVNLCCLDPANECKDPFFIKSVNGDHNIIAITKDHNIFYCGYQMDGGNDLAMMRQLKRFPTMEPEEYFIDISATHYRTLYLTNKFNIYENNNLLCNLSERIGGPVQSCTISASSYIYFFAINSNSIYSYSTQISSLELIHSNINPKPFKTLDLTGSSSIIIGYWTSSNESKSIIDQKNNLKKRVSDSLLSDIVLL